MGMEKAINMLEELAKQGFKINEGDYIGEDGLLYCGKCHTKKQVRIKLPDGKELYLILELSTTIINLECKMESYKLLWN